MPAAALLLSWASVIHSLPPPLPPLSPPPPSSSAGTPPGSAKAGGNCSSPSVNVKLDFGAVGNGLVDDLPHIQAAIDSVAAGCGGGLVSLPPGT